MALIYGGYYWYDNFKTRKTKIALANFLCESQNVNAENIKKMETEMMNMMQQFFNRNTDINDLATTGQNVKSLLLETQKEMKNSSKLKSWHIKKMQEIAKKATSGDKKYKIEFPKETAKILMQECPIKFNNDYLLATESVVFAVRASESQY